MKSLSQIGRVGLTVVIARVVWINEKRLARQGEKIMGWDNWSNGGKDLTDKRDIEMDLKDKDVGLKEFEVEKVVTFVVRYKTLGKDKYGLDHLYLGCSDLDIGDLENKKVYDFAIRNCGESEETKPHETGNKVEKEYWAEKKDKDFNEKEYDLKIQME